MTKRRDLPIYIAGFMVALAVGVGLDVSGWDNPWWVVTVAVTLIHGTCALIVHLRNRKRPDSACRA